MKDLSTIEPDMGKTVVDNRTIQTVTLEIKTLHAQAQQVMLSYAIEIGRRLVEAKAMLEHGQWGTWLKDEVSFSKSTANNLMKIYDEYGANQQCLFGAEAKSQTLGDLPYTKALKLLAVPDEEREEFVKEHNVAEMSTRELDKALKDREEAQTLLEQAEDEKARVVAENSRVQAEKEKVQKEKDRLEKEAKTAEEKVLALEKEMETLRNLPKEIAVEKVVDHGAVQLAVAEARIAEREHAEQRLQEQIQELEEAKKQAHEQMEVAQNAREALEVVTAEKDELQADLESAKEEAENERLQFEKKLATTSTSEIVTFKLHFTQVQDLINKMLDIIRENREQGNLESAEKLGKALSIVLKSTLDVIEP